VAAARRPTASPNSFAHVSLPAQLVFYAGVFCVFAPFSLIYDLAMPKGLPWTSLATWSVYSGLTAVGWAYAFIRNLRFLWFHVPASFVVAALFGDTFYRRSDVRLALVLEAAICIAVILLGYVFFVVFISGEGTKTIRLRTEIGLAKQIHDHLVPAVAQRTEHLELYGISQPASEVGGDLMDVCHADDKTGLYVADVTGHGVPAGVSMGMIKSAIRMKLREAPPLGELVAGLNDVLSQTQRPGTLATLAALELRRDGTAHYALAGHLPILHFRAASRELHKLPNAHPPLGVFEGRSFAHVQVATAPGDLFVILTDGLTEVFDREGEEFGEARIERLVEQGWDRPLAEIHEAILAAVRAFGPQVDDQTLLLARVR
jgi:hypothetical protein